MHMFKDSMWRKILKSFWILGESKQGLIICASWSLLVRATLQLHKSEESRDGSVFVLLDVVLALALVPRHGIHHIMTILFQSDSDARGVRRRSDAAAAHIHSTSAENLPGTHSLGGV